MSQIPVIAVTGGPCGGKSTFLVQARGWLEKHGIYPFIVPETATELIMAGITPDMLGSEAFQEELLLYSMDREKHYLDIALRAEQSNIVILCDRGVLDGQAYMDADAFCAMLGRHNCGREVLLQRYRLALHLVTAADGAETHYTLANNQARSESLTEARAVDQRTQRAWLGHQHHVIVDNATDFTNKMHRALCALARVLNMPEPLEIERKFRVDDFRTDSIPADAVAIDIRQDYLTSKSPMVRRVRLRILNGETSYFYTEKLPTEQSGTRVERERQIPEEEYNLLLQERDPHLHSIMKTRYAFPFGGKLFELDVFKGRRAGLVLLEVELQDIDEPITLPEHWTLVEVTDDPSFANYSLAKG